LKVLFLIQGSNVAASRYRVLQYIPYLKHKGVKIKVISYPRSFIENWIFFKSLNNYDIIFCQRKRFHSLRLWFLKKKANKIVFDFDDSIMFRNSNAKNPISKTRMRRFVNMIKASDGVIAGNEYLKKKALKYNTNVIVLPSPIDMEKYSKKNHDPNKNDVILGWIGDFGSIHYLEKMKPVFDILGRKYQNLKLKIVCGVFFDCNQIEVIKKQWNSKDEIKDLQSFDIGLMPLMDDPWSWGKCGLKIIQYQGVAVPVVCTPVGINKDLVKDGENGFWARNHKEWIEKLSILIEDSHLRKEMGVIGRDRVKKECSFQVCAPRIYQFLKNILRN